MLCTRCPGLSRLVPVSPSLSRQNRPCGGILGPGLGDRKGSERTLNPRVRGPSPWRRTCENLPGWHTAVERVVERTALAALRWPHAAPQDRSHRATAERLFPRPRVCRDRPADRPGAALPADREDREQAQVVLGRLLEQAADGRRPDTDVTVAEVLARYMAIAELDPSTRNTYAGYIRRTILPALGSMGTPQGAPRRGRGGLAARRRPADRPAALTTGRRCCLWPAHRSHRYWPAARDPRCGPP